MDLFNGLSDRIRKNLDRSAIRMVIPEGALLFKEGDPVDGCYLITKGCFGIYHRRPDPKAHNKIVEIPAAVVGRGGILGEMALINFKHVRTAYARAIEESEVIHYKPFLVEEIFRKEDPEQAFIFLGNIITYMADRLRRRQRSIEYDPLKKVPDVAKYLSEPDEILDRVEKALPRSGIWRKSVSIKKLAKGKELVTQGDKSDRLYFIHEGVLEVYIQKGEEAVRVNRRLAPDVIGELGFFADSPRTATVKALTDVKYSQIKKSDFNKLKKDHPEEALMLLMAGASLIAHLIVGLTTYPEDLISV